jgi:pyrroloquinoline-quinone synthase
MNNALDVLLGDDYSRQRAALIHHPLWESLERGAASLEQLRAFALQDHWLVGHSLQLEAQLIARLTNTDDARAVVRRAARRSFDFEKLFYDTIFTVGQARD